MSLLVHAEAELRRAGMYDADADYGPGAIASHVLELVKVFASGGHSGGSAALTLALFERLARFRPLTPLTSDPDEWMEVGPHMWPEGKGTVWQNRRQGSCFSKDGGKTYYDIHEEGHPTHTAETPKPAEASP